MSLFYSYRNHEVESKVDRLQAEKQLSQEQLKIKESKLAAIERELQGLLEDDERIKLEMQDKGLVITLANNILFDSGKAKIKNAYLR